MLVACKTEEEVDALVSFFKQSGLQAQYFSPLQQKKSTAYQPATIITVKKIGDLFFLYNRYSFAAETIQKDLDNIIYLHDLFAKGIDYYLVAEYL